LNRALAREILRSFRLSEGVRQGVVSWRAFRRRDWDRALEWLDRAGLSLYFWWHQKEIGTDELLPPEVSTRLARNFADNRTRVAFMSQECDLLNRLFEEAGVQYALLKGFAMIPDYCPDASLRTQYDYDYLLSSESLGRADQALRAAGYLRKIRNEEHPIVYFHSSRHPQAPSTRDDLYSSRLHSSVELHLKLWEADREKIHLTSPEGAISRARERNGQGLRFFALADEDALTFQVLHAFRHILNYWCRLSIFFEIAHFLERRSADLSFWERFRALTRSDRDLSAISGVIFSLAAKLFGATSPILVTGDPAERPPASLDLWVTRYGMDSALDNFSANKFSLFLHREFVPDRSSWEALRRSRLFPLRLPSRATAVASGKSLSRWAASCRQGLYVVQRAVHHLTAAIRYGWESTRWKRLRTSDR